MKRVIILVILAIIMTANAADAGRYGGFRAGANMATLSGDDADGMDTRTALTAGVFGGMSLNERVDLRAELLYMQKGAEGDFVIPGDDHSHDSKISLDYIEVPVLCALRFPTGGATSFSLFAGPTFGFNVNGEIETSHGTEDFPDVNGFEFGGTLGGDAAYDLDTMSFILDVRYGFGFTSVDGSSLEADVKNRGFAISGGVAFPFGE